MSDESQVREQMGACDQVPESLFERIAAGDRAAVSECISRHGGLVWSMALRLLGGNRADAEDAVQEIFIELWRNAIRYVRERGSEEMFVATVARRRLIDRRRRMGRRPSVLRLPEGLVEPGVDVAEQAARSDEADRALRALNELPEEYRRVLALAIGRGMTQVEIGRELGMPLGTVKTYARRGLQELRARLAAEPVMVPGEAVR